MNRDYDNAGAAGVARTGDDSVVDLFALTVLM